MLELRHKYRYHQANAQSTEQVTQPPTLAMHTYSQKMGNSHMQP